MLKVGEVLEKDQFQTSEGIAKKASLNERTVWNIGADLVLFGVAERQGTSFKLHRDMADRTVRGILSRIRIKIDKLECAPRGGQFTQLTLSNPGRVFLHSGWGWCSPERNAVSSRCTLTR